MKRLLIFLLAAMVVSCEKMVLTDGDTDNVTITFTAMNKTRGVAEYFQKLNVQLFDEDGEKVFDKVKTQLSTDDDFGQMSMSLSEGDYTIVAVGHSSIKSATIKSPVMVQFTASDGEKLTDTFCYCGQISVGEEPSQYHFTMRRVAAMFQMVITDEEVPESFARMKFDYTGGSANFNPSTFVGTTKSTQSELRTRGNSYQVYTFPYQAESGVLKIKVSALDANDQVIRSRTFSDIPVTRNRITTYTGHFFEPGDGNITQTDFGFNVNGEWDGEDRYEF